MTPQLQDAIPNAGGPSSCIFFESLVVTHRLHAKVLTGYESVICLRAGTVLSKGLRKRRSVLRTSNSWRTARREKSSQSLMAPVAVGQGSERQEFAKEKLLGFDRRCRSDGVCSKRNGLVRCLFGVLQLWPWEDELVETDWDR